MANYALIVGVDYKGSDSLSELDYAFDDATSIHNFLLINGYESIPVYGSQADCRIITKKLKLICDKLEAGDTFVFYFSGHGFQTENDQYLLPHDAETWAILNKGGNALSVEFIETATHIAGVQRILIIDACRKPVEKNKASIGEIDGINEKAILGTIKHSSLESPLGVFCSCGPRERSYEFKEIGAGVFTYALRKIFDDCTSRGEEISFPKIVDQVHVKVASLVETYACGAQVQTPFFRGKKVVLIPQSPSADKPINRQPSPAQATTEPFVSANIDPISTGGFSGILNRMQGNIFSPIAPESMKPTISPAPIEKFPLYNKWQRGLGISTGAIEFVGRQVAISAYSQHLWMDLLTEEIAAARAPSLCIGFSPQNISHWRAGFKKGINLECSLKVYNPDNRWDAKVSIGAILFDTALSACVSGMLSPIRIDELEHASMKYGGNVLANYNGVDDLISITPFGMEFPCEGMMHKDERMYQLILIAVGPEGVIGFCHNKLFFRLGFAGSKSRFL